MAQKKAPFLWVPMSSVCPLRSPMRVDCIMYHSKRSVLTPVKEASDGTLPLAGRGIVPRRAGATRTQFEKGSAMRMYVMRFLKSSPGMLESSLR